MKAPRTAADRAESRFDVAWFRTPRATWALILAFCVVYLWATWLDVRPRTDWAALIFGARSDEALTDLGGRARGLVARGQLWRLLTCGFLHHDPLHLLLNALAMLGLGKRAEAVWGPVRLLLVFFLAVVGGALLSQLGGGALSVGASGGVFGVMGALVAFAWRRRSRLGPLLRDALGRELVPWIFLNLAVGALIPAIDNLAHVGGLLTGALVGALLGDRITDNGEDTPGMRALQALVAWFFVVVALLGLPLSLFLG